MSAAACAEFMRLRYKPEAGVFDDDAMARTRGAMTRCRSALRGRVARCNKIIDGLTAGQAANEPWRVELQRHMTGVMLELGDVLAPTPGFSDDLTRDRDTIAAEAFYRLDGAGYIRDWESMARNVADVTGAQAAAAADRASPGGGEVTARTAPMSKSELARRIQNRPTARPRDVAEEWWAKHDLQPFPGSGRRFTLCLSQIKDENMRARLTAPGT